MRNLKRVLSLALALVMVLGMMVIGTSAATFTDAAEIEYKEAVEVMSALEIIKGMGDGTFAPKATLTREQAAKILAYVTMGAGADEYLAGTTAPFADVAATKWSAKYIAYCKNLGIINGVGDDKFNPAGTLKVVEFAKMLLVAAGIEGTYTGANWANNVKTMVAKTPAMAATGIKISNAEITREEACELALAAMKSGGSTVRYYDVKVGNEVVGTFTDIVDAYVMKDVVSGTVAYRDVTTGTLLKTVYGVEFLAADKDAFGNPGVGYEKTNVQGKKVLDLFFGEKATLTYTSNMNTVAGKKAIVADLKAQGVELTDLTAGNYRFSDGKMATVDGKANDTYCNSTNVLAELTAANKVVKVYIDKKAVVLVTVENTYATTVSKVIEADAKKEIDASIEMANGLTFKTDKFEKNDVVLVTKAWNGTKYVAQTVVEAEAVTGTLSAYTKDNKFTIGEKVYEMSNIALSSAADVIAAYGKEMVYSLDANGKIIAVAAPGKAPVVAPVITDYAIVLSTNAAVKNTTVSWPTTSTTTEVAAKLQVLLSNGAVEIWDLAILKADKAIAGTSIAKGEYYYLMGQTPVKVDVKTNVSSEAATNALNTDLADNFSGIYTYADKALVASVAGLTGAETKDATVQFANGNTITKATYVSGGVILNDKTVFVLKAADPTKGYVVKTGLAALENTSIANGIQVVAAVTAGKNQDGEPDATKNVVVASVVFAVADSFAADTSVATTQNYALVNGNYTVTVVGADTYRTYGVVYADGTTGSVVVKNEQGNGMATGAYLLKADGSIDASTGITATKTVKLVSGTTVIFTDGTAKATTAKTVVVGGELAAEAEAFIIEAYGAIALAFIVE